MAGKRFVIIGISDGEAAWAGSSGEEPLRGRAVRAIRQTKVFSGGKRHHDLVAGLLPEGHRWIDIVVPLDKVFEDYERAFSEGNDIVVFASGDPLFYGFATTIKTRMPEAEIEVFPAFNSLQMLAHRLLMPYGDMRMVSLTGRPWHELDRALIEGSRLIGVLTDGEHTPARIASRLKYYGFDAYIIYIGEHLGNESKERVTRMTLEEASTYEAARPNCILLEGEAQGGGDQRRIRGRWPLQGGAGEEMGHWRP